MALTLVLVVATTLIQGDASAKRPHVAKVTREQAKGSVLVKSPQKDCPVVGKERVARLKLHVGKVYESKGRFAEAEEAYKAALAADCLPTRRSAYLALTGLIGRRESALQRYVGGPWS